MVPNKSEQMLGVWQRCEGYSFSNLGDFMSHNENFIGLYAFDVFQRSHKYLTSDSAFPTREFS